MMLLAVWLVGCVLVVVWMAGATSWSVLDVLGSYNPVAEAEAILEEER